MIILVNIWILVTATMDEDDMSESASKASDEKKNENQPLKVTST